MSFFNDFKSTFVVYVDIFIYFEIVNESFKVGDFFVLLQIFKITSSYINENNKLWIHKSQRTSINQCHWLHLYSIHLRKSPLKSGKRAGRFLREKNLLSLLKSSRVRYKTAPYNNFQVTGTTH